MSNIIKILAAISGIIGAVLIVPYAFLALVWLPFFIVGGITDILLVEISIIIMPIFPIWASTRVENNPLLATLLLLISDIMCFILLMIPGGAFFTIPSLVLFVATGLSFAAYITEKKTKQTYSEKSL